MTAYAFRAVRPDGGRLTGTVEAPNEAAAADMVMRRGLLPTDLRERDRKQRSASADVLVAPFAGLAALLDAGLPVDKALAGVEETAPTELREVLRTARQRVTEGASLSAALADTGIASPQVLGLLRAGERTGRLPEAVGRAADDLERAADTRASVRAMLAYPVFLAVAGTVSVVAIAGFVVPRFAELLSAHGSALPTSTRALLALSGLVSHYAIAVLATLAVATVVLLRWLRTAKGQGRLHEFLLAIPLVGDVRLRLASSRMCNTLGGLLDAGVPALQALQLAGTASGDLCLQRRADAARADVERGEAMARSLERHNAISPLSVRLALFGEKAGSLPAFLAHAARLEERTARRSLQKAVAMLEPLLILFFGVIVAFVAAALLQAVYSLRPGGPPL